MERKWIAITASSPDFFYVGKTELDDFELSDLCRANLQLVLYEATIMRRVLSTKSAPSSRKWIQQFIGLSEKPIDLRIVPKSYFWLFENADSSLAKDLEAGVLGKEDPHSSVKVNL